MALQTGARNRYMYFKEKEIQQAKKISGLTHPCFYVTIAIDVSDLANEFGRNNNDCLVVTKNLLDSGAAAHFISRKVVEKLRLHTFRLHVAKEFEVANGQILSHREYVRVPIWLGGVKRSIMAFVDDSQSNMLFILGEPAWDDFLISKSVTGVGKQRIKTVTVAWDVTGCRRNRFMVQQDSNGFSEMIMVAKTHRLARRAREGKTSAEVTAKMKADAVRRRLNLAMEKAKAKAKEAHWW